ncbi:unnamed protein product [Ectocarpus sp. 4 AP-2014]
MDGEPPGCQGLDARGGGNCPPDVGHKTLRCPSRHAPRRASVPSRLLLLLVGRLDKAKTVHQKHATRDYLHPHLCLSLRRWSTRLDYGIRPLPIGGGETMNQCQWEA